MLKRFLAAGAAAMLIAVPTAAHDHKDKPKKAKSQAKKAEKGPKPGRGNAARAASGRAGPPSLPPGQAKKLARQSAPVAIDGGNPFATGQPLRFNGRARLNCPPGLAKKDNGCLPPGQAKKLVGAPIAAAFANDRIPLAYRSWYRDNDDFYFRAGDGFIFRINRGSGLVDGLIPLFGSGYYAVGDPWPEAYDFYNLPHQYRGYWADGSDYRYRYGDGAIYRVNAETAAIQSIVALLAGDLGVGSRLPSAYSVYNVPIAYRDRYYDTRTDWYRYNDGYIYRVDPTTMMITAVIDAIT